MFRHIIGWDFASNFFLVAYKEYTGQLDLAESMEYAGKRVNHLLTHSK